MTFSQQSGSGEPVTPEVAPAADEVFVERPTRAKPPKKQDKTTMILLLAAAFVAVGGVGFAVGHMTGSGATANAAPSFGRGGFGARVSLAPGQTFNIGAFGGRGGAGGLTGGVSGTVQSVDGSTMTVQLASGATVTIDLTGTTTYHGTTAASSSDVKVGSSVTVQIATNASAAETPAPGSSGGRTLSAQDVIITHP